MLKEQHFQRDKIEKKHFARLTRHLSYLFVFHLMQRFLEYFGSEPMHALKIMGKFAIVTILRFFPSSPLTMLWKKYRNLHHAF